MFLSRLAHDNMHAYAYYTAYKLVSYISYFHD